MYRLILLLLCTILYTSPTAAQPFIPLDENTYVQYLQRAKDTTKHETKRLQFQLLLAEYWAPVDSLKSIQLLHSVLLSPHLNSLAPGEVAYYQGVLAGHQNQKKEALEHYDQAIDKLRPSDLLVKAHYNRAYLAVEDKGYDHIVRVLTDQCIPISKTLGDPELLAFCYTQLGLVFMSVGQFATAQEYHDSALKALSKASKASPIRLLTYLNMVSNYCYKPDSKTAKVYLDKAFELIRHYPQSRHYPNYHYQEAMYYTTIQDVPQTLASLQKGIQLAKAQQQAKQLQLLYFRLYNVYVLQKEYTQAKQVLEHILAENILNKEAVNRKITYTQLADVNHKLGNHAEAYRWLQQSSALSDSLQQVKLLEKMNALDILHQTTEKEQTIERLQQEKRANELMSKNKNLRIIILATALVLSVVIVLLIFRNYKKQEELNKQISRSHQQELLRMEQERRYEATKAVLQGEEQERQRIARDLHDSIGGMLANIRLTISHKHRQESPELLTKLDKTITEMRRIARNLMPEALKNLGLETALKELCMSMSTDKLYIQFEAYTLDADLPFDTQLALYRIVQEGISNISKYAFAQTAIVQLSQHDNQLSLTIEDDGVGFDPEQQTPGLGLRNIQNRVALLNGQLQITSSKGKGTTLHIECTC